MGAADGEIPWGELLAPPHQLSEIKKTPLASAKSASARQNRHGKWCEWRAPSARSLVPFQRKLSAIDRHLCLAAVSFLFLALYWCVRFSLLDIYSFFAPRCNFPPSRYLS